MTGIIAYDIEDDAIRRRLAGFLEKKGVRLQRSVFAVEADRLQFDKILDGVREITEGEGNVAVFSLCAGCCGKAIQFGADHQAPYRCF